MSMQVDGAHEILEANFDGASTDEQRLEFARTVDNHPEMVESLVQEVFIHSLLQWDSERAALAVAPPGPIVASQSDDPYASPD